MVTLTDPECDSVRLLTGKDTRTAQLTNEDIRSEAILGEANDYVESRVEYASLTETLDQNRYKRAVIYRCAGLSVGLISKISRETANSIEAQTLAIADWKDLRDSHFAEADAIIGRLTDEVGLSVAFLVG